MVRHLGIGESFCAAGDAITVELHTGQSGGDAAGRDQDMLCGEVEIFGLSRHGNFPWARDARSAEYSRDLVLLEQVFDAFGERGDDAVFALEHRLQIEVRLGAFDSVRPETVSRFGEQLA